MWFCFFATFYMQSASVSQPSSFHSAGSDFAVPERICEIAFAPLKEASGLIASRVNPGIFYTHNDSGGLPIVYAFDRAGTIKAQIELVGATNVDWEDIAIGPGAAAGTWDVCVGDIGDNKCTRRSLTLYRFRDEILKPNRDSKPAVIQVKPTLVEFRYEDGPCDAEALAVHPSTGDGYIIQKRGGGPAAVYRIPAPWKSEGVQNLQRIGEMRFPEAAPIQTLVTAADFSPDGCRLVVRTYLCGWIWSLPAKTPPDDVLTLIRAMPVRIDLSAEKQGEAVCFSSDGRCLLTISEGCPTWLNESCETPNETAGAALRRP